MMKAAGAQVPWLAMEADGEGSHAKEKRREEGRCLLIPLRLGALA